MKNKFFYGVKIVSLWIRGLLQCISGLSSFEKGQIKGSAGMKVICVLLAGIKVVPFPFWKILKTKTFSHKAYF